MTDDGNEDENFELSYHPLSEKPDFLVLAENILNIQETSYVGRRVRVNYPLSDEFFYGTVASQSVRDPIDHPLSLWECLRVQWDDKEEAQHQEDQFVNPWEIELCTDDDALDPSSSRSPPLIFSSQERLMEGLKAIAQLPFVFIFTMPVSLSDFPSYFYAVEYAMDVKLIYRRIKFDFYRSLQALIQDCKQITVNALKFNDDSSAIVLHARTLSDRLLCFVQDQEVPESCNDIALGQVEESPRRRSARFTQNVDLDAEDEPLPLPDEDPLPPLSDVLSSPSRSRSRPHHRSSLTSSSSRKPAGSRRTSLRSRRSADGLSDQDDSFSHDFDEEDEDEPEASFEDDEEDEDIDDDDEDDREELEDFELSDYDDDEEGFSRSTRRRRSSTSSTPRRKKEEPDPALSSPARRPSQAMLFASTKRQQSPLDDRHPPPAPASSSSSPARPLTSPDRPRRTSRSERSSRVSPPASPPLHHSLSSPGRSSRRSSRSDHFPPDLDHGREKEEDREQEDELATSSRPKRTRKSPERFKIVLPPPSSAKKTTTPRAKTDPITPEPSPNHNYSTRLRSGEGGLGKRPRDNDFVDPDCIEQHIKRHRS